MHSGGSCFVPWRECNADGGSCFAQMVGIVMHFAQWGEYIADGGSCFARGRGEVGDAHPLL